VAETTRANGRDFLTAVVAGYEVAVRVSVSMRPDYRAGRYSTGIWGGFGSVAAVGKLLKLDQRTFQDALGVFAAHGPSPPGGDFLHESMVKESIAWAGATGCASALLARQGFAGPSDALDRSRRYDPNQLVKGLGGEYAILRTYFKPYASCRWSHPAIDGVLALLKDNHLRLEEIKEIHIEGFQPITMLVDYTPASTVAAQYSIPFSVALALSHGGIGPGELTEAKLRDARLLELAGKVKVSVDPELDRLFPEQTAMRATLRTQQGDFTTTVEYPKGDPANPLSDAELEEKFYGLTVEVMGEERSRGLKEAVEHLHQMEDIKDLAQLLAF
jgi:2-methylcitrate dehydratase PrpD